MACRVGYNHHQQAVVIFKNFHTLCSIWKHQEMSLNFGTARATELPKTARDSLVPQLSVGGNKRASEGSSVQSNNAAFYHQITRRKVVALNQ